jgi:signal transduction histidine kinase
MEQAEMGFGRQTEPNGLRMPDELAGVLAYELERPLSSAACNTTTALEAARVCPHQNCGNVQVLEDLLDDCRKLRCTFQRIHQLARVHPERRGFEDVNDLVLESVQALPRDAWTAGVAFRKRLEPGLPQVRIHRRQIQEVMLNVIRNALEAIVEAKTTRPVVQIHTRRQPGRKIEIAIRDNGTGIPAELLPRLSYEFLTTKPNGIGLGLMLSRLMVERHQGRLIAENNARGGATIRITLPLDSKAKT